MATDYDAPRKTDEESEDSIEELKTRRNDKNSGKVDEDEVEAAEAFIARLNMRAIAIESKGSSFVGTLKVFIEHSSQLGNLLSRLQKIKGVQRAIRVNR